MHCCNTLCDITVEDTTATSPVISENSNRSDAGCIENSQSTGHYRFVIVKKCDKLSGYRDLLFKEGNLPSSIEKCAFLCVKQQKCCGFHLSQP